MKFGITWISVLVCIFFTKDSLAQKLTKNEILKEYLAAQTNPALDSIFRWDVHVETRITLDKLLKAGVDTLLVYSVDLPGYFARKEDSCVAIYPVNSYFFWKDRGKYFSKATNCTSEQKTGNGNVISACIDNFSKIENEFFMGVILEAEMKDGKIRVRENSVDHEPKYSILILLNHRLKYLTFTEDGLNNKTSLFLDYNKSLFSYKLFKLIEEEISKE